MYFNKCNINYIFNNNIFCASPFCGHKNTIF